ncbi:response regulator [candidate division KSB1 bacterium]|nr:MAG: response regulator [candidate division KSB1 bacterium]RPH96622.1 MAG: response regulator [candidate division KSB1 bacterium]
MEILLVEDSPGDVRLTAETLREGKIRNRLHVVWDGVEAMDYLHSRGPYAEAARPDLILLDLNLPKKDGREVLFEIKSDENLRSIPVIVLTTSDNDLDVLSCYDLHANCYIVKPVNLDKFIEVIKTIEGFWLNIVTLPHTNA